MGLAAALCAAILLPRGAAAQAAPGSVEIGGGLGRFYGGSFARGSVGIADRKIGADDDVLKGFWLAAQWNRAWGLELAFRRTKTHAVERGAGVAPTEPAIAVFIPATFELLAVRSFRHGNLLPYYGFGAGIMNVEFDTGDPAVRDVNRLCLSLAAGARLYAIRWFGFRVDLRSRGTYLGRRRLGEDRGWSDSGRWFTNAELVGGIFFSFGGR